MIAQETCALCEGREFSKYCDVPPYTLVKCTVCGLVFVSPLPEEDEIKRINESIYSCDDYREIYLADACFFRRWSKDKLKTIEAFCPRKGKILDFGCSCGHFLEVARKRGWDIYGVEMNPINADYAQKRLGDKIFKGTIEDGPFASDIFDVITLWDVLEHIAQPVEFLRRLQKRLAPSGIICIQAPNIESYISDLKGKDWDWLSPGDHLYFFSQKTLHSTLEKAGLKPIYSTTWQPYGYLIDNLFGFNHRDNAFFRLYRKTVVRILRKLLFPLFAPLQWILKRRNKGALVMTFGAVKEEQA
ncbi:class I SAM-dependent methyltransferase [Gemmatimonadota bacterium]